MKANKRKAWIYSRASAPPLKALFGTGVERKAFVKYWVEDNIWNGLHLLGHFGMKLLPMDACSALGARLGLFAIPRFHKVAEARARATIAALRPDLSSDEQHALFLANCRAQGRLMTEFSMINRLARHRDRLDIHDMSRLEESLAKGPVIIIGMHLGNWEIGPVILQAIGTRPYANYIPPPERAKAWIAQRVRRKAGLRFLPPGHQGTRQTVSLLKQGGVISMFCDEGFGGRIRGPLFGRPPHLEGNLAVAVRLARMTGATICPWYNLRHDGFRFSCQFLEPITLPAEQRPGERLMDDIQLLNDAIEPVIRAHLDQWYFVDNRLS